LSGEPDNGFESAPRVVVVDDDPLVLAVTRRLLQRAGYQVVPCDHPRMALREVVQSQPFALVADLHMPDLSGADLLRVVRSVSPGTRRVLYTGEAQVSELTRAIAPMVADAIVAKTDGPEFLPAALDGLRTQPQAGAGPAQARSLALGMARALASSVVETFDHALRVSRYSRRLGSALGLDSYALVDLEVGALLHDIGMIGVSDAVLRYPGPLGEHEWHEVQQHPELGASMLRECETLAGALPVVLHHHERFDGRGYPAGLVGEAIPLPARIFAVVDAYEAVTQLRPYAAARSNEEARQEIAQNAGTQFDPAVAEAFLRMENEEFRRVTVPPRL
jgi:response regulator RpfG family c-di-GMP phosphodiesterase